MIETRKKFRKLKRKNKDCKEYATRYNFLTKLIRNEKDEINNNDWSKFIENQGKNPTSTKPFWKKINKIRGKSTKSSIPVLKVDQNVYQTDDEKANLFANMLKTTFADGNDDIFDINALSSSTLFSISSGISIGNSCLK